jgi:protein SCO1/2
MNRFWRAMAGFTLAVFIPVGFWYYYFGYKGLPQSLPKYFPTGEVKHYSFRGADKVDSVYETIAPFYFQNQMGDTISNDTTFNKTLKNKIYVANFFFCSCNTICPIMTKQLVRIQTEFKDVEWVKILSFTVDPEHDSVQKLLQYAQKFGINEDQWHLLTGPKDKLYQLCLKSFKLAAQSDGPESFDHSNKVVLVDNRGIIRGYYDGTDSISISKLMADIVIQLKDLSSDVFELRPPRK